MREFAMSESNRPVPIDTCGGGTPPVAAVALEWAAHPSTIARLAPQSPAFPIEALYARFSFALSRARGAAREPKAFSARQDRIAPCVS